MNIIIKTINTDLTDLETINVPIPNKKGIANKSAPKKHFIKGPIYLDWISPAAQLAGKAINVALAIHWLHGMNQGKPFKITQSALTKFNLSNDAYLDGLRKLEKAKLVSVLRKPGQRALIMVIECN
jgi:hypothetical protein